MSSAFVLQNTWRWFQNGAIFCRWHLRNVLQLASFATMWRCHITKNVTMCSLIWRGWCMCEKILHEAWDHLWGMVNQQFIFLFTVDHTKCLIIILGNAFRRFLHAPKSKVCCFTFWSQSLKRLESSLCND